MLFECPAHAGHLATMLQRPLLQVSLCFTVTDCLDHPGLADLTTHVVSLHLLLWWTALPHPGCADLTMQMISLCLVLWLTALLRSGCQI